MAGISLPPGFRFHPTDVELVMYYLKRKVSGKKFKFEAITELNIYKFSPWDLPDKSCLRSKDLEWFFFCPKVRKYASGARVNRATDTGYWKTTGKDRAILHDGKNVGMIKTLVFHQGHAPSGVRTDWVIHEYRIQDNQLADAGIEQDAFVLCKLFKKNGPGPKNGAQYGAPFNEAEWDDDLDDVTFGFGVNAACTSSALALPETPSCSALTSKVCTGTISVQSLPEPGPSSSGGPPANMGVSDDGIPLLLAPFTEDGYPHPSNNDNEMLDDSYHQRNINTVPHSDGDDGFYGLSDLGDWQELGNSGIQVAGDVPNPVVYPDAFLELNDLDIPLSSSVAANGSEHMLANTNSYAMHNSYCNMEGLYSGANHFGTDQYCSVPNQLALLPGSYCAVASGSEMLLVNGGTDIPQIYNASYGLAITELDQSRGISYGGNGTNNNASLRNTSNQVAFSAQGERSGIERNCERGRSHNF